MTRPASLVILLFLLLSAAACKREASAQASRDSLAPLRCFQIVDAEQLAAQSAIELCAGTPSVAPGRCYAASIDAFPELSTQQAQQLCTAATSLEPVDCYARLEAEGTLTESQIISYCATFCPLGPPPPQASDPACLQAAMDRTDLSLQQAGQLCLGSSSAGPAECMDAGQGIHQLSDSNLVQLCAETFRCQYYNVQPAPSY